MTHVAEASCMVCFKSRTIIHTAWVWKGGHLETPICEHCGASWQGYGALREIEMDGQAVIWDESE